MSTHHLVYGGDYNPEQWSEEVWHEDVRLMKQARVNRVTVGVFAWSTLEPAPGEYHFEWLDKVLDLLHNNQIGVILATPTASPPPWFTHKHPEALPVTADGVRLIHGSRDTYNPAAPAYRHAAAAITTKLAERYAHHPAVTMWHVHNEYGTVSYGPVTDTAFRTWLQRRYGTLATLNNTWNTAFWSQGYSDWAHIHAPQATQYLPNPAHVLDFKRFSADMQRECLAEQVALLRAANPAIPITTNYMLASWLHYDQWDVAAEIDQVSIDNYPSSRGIGGDVQVAFGADLARSFNAGRPWTLMDQATSLIYDYAAGRYFARPPGDLLRNTLQYIARGATGSLFFQWRAPRVGAELFHSPMVPHVGEDSRVFREITELGQLLAGLAELAEPPAPGRRVNTNRVAIAWDSLSWWSAETRALPSTDVAFLPAVQRVHRALWELGINADVVPLGGGQGDGPGGGPRGGAGDGLETFSAYDLILVPSALAVSPQAAQRLDAFVQAGGHTATWYLAGTANEHLHVLPGSFSAAFAEMNGVRVEEHHPLAADETLTLSDGSTADCWSETVQLRGARAVAAFADGPLAGQPAITEHRRGAGVAHYVATRLDAAALRTHLARIAALAGVHPEHPAAGDGVEVVRRAGAAHDYLFVFNHRDAAVTLQLTGTDLLTGRVLSGPTELAVGGVLVVRTPAIAPANAAQ